MKIPLDQYSRLCQKYRAIVESLEKERIDFRNLPVGEVPEPPQQNILFFPDTAQNRFQEFADNDVRIFKLCNFNQAASKITWYKKHVHHTTKNVSLETVKSWHKDFVTTLEVEKKAREKDEDHYSLVDIAQVKKDIKSLQKLIDNFDQYTISRSNYFKYYHYYFMNYQYWVNGKKKTASTQLFVDNEKEKINIVFLDMNRIMEKTYKTSKKSESYLESFTGKVYSNRYDLFFKKKKG